MRNFYYIFLSAIAVLGVFSCSRIQNENTSPEALFPDPLSHSLNLTEGYIMNPVTGDSIKPIINSLGDTVKSGVEIRIAGKLLNADSLQNPLVFQTGHEPAKVIPLHSNIFACPDSLSNVVFPKEKLTKKRLPSRKNTERNNFIATDKGDSIETGIPVTVTPREVLLNRVQSYSVSPPRMKDDASSNIQYFDVDQGMRSSIVKSVIEDKRGYLWFGTTSGLSVYDGVNLTHYTRDEGLSENVVMSVIEDRKGNIWVATFGGGVCKFNGKSFLHFTMEDGMSNNNILTVYEDRAGNIWMGTNGSGVSKFDGTSLTHYTVNEGLSDNSVWSIYEDADGNMWFGTAEGGVNKFDGSIFTHYSTREGLTNNMVLCINQDSKGNIWLGTYGGGLNKLEVESESAPNIKIWHYTDKEGLANNTVLTILEDKKGDLWFGTNGGGVSVFNGHSFTNYTEKEGLSHSSIWSLIQDKAGNIWAATYGGGVNIFGAKSFKHDTKQHQLGENNVLVVFEDSKGTLWFGTNGKGVCSFDGFNFKFYTANDGLCDNTILSIAQDNSGNLWFGSADGGISKFNGKSFTNFSVNQGLSFHTILSVLADTKGNIWLGTLGGGITKIEQSGSDTIARFRHYTDKMGLGSNVVQCVFEDNEGNIWFGTAGGGVVKYNGKSIFNITEKEGLINNNVNCITQDSLGNMWFGTSGAGICRFDGTQFISISEREGLFSNNIRSLIFAGAEKLWVSTDKGLHYFGLNLSGESAAESNSKTNKKSIILQSISFQNEDGLKGQDFFVNSACIDSKNRVWWGNAKSLTAVNLSDFYLNFNKPEVYLNQVEINGQYLNYHNAVNFKDDFLDDVTFSGVEPFQNYPEGLELPYNKNHISFKFAGIEWGALGKIKYSYRLLGFSEMWSSPSSETKADYRNIPYGNYTFQVKAIGESQIWSDTFEYSFLIHRPWWHTWWARAFYAVLALTIILTLIKWRTAALKSRQKELETEVETATREIRKQKQSVEQQKELIEEKHKEITDSINYAERLQKALMANKILLDTHLNNYFIFFNSKEKVSGDFYWAAELENGTFLLACADSTGHGVPGAIMSMMNMNSLKESVKDGYIRTDEILNNTRKIIIDTLANDGSTEGGRDGMDCSLLCFDFGKRKLQCSLANNPMWIIRGMELIEIKPDKMPVGKHDKQEVPFVLHEVDILPGDMVYTFTDGYADQFGGENGKKFKYSNLQKLLLEISGEELHVQSKILEGKFNSWRGNLEQIDDVCIIGVRI
jgi:ligand-binding sensor domain-containing protein/serine phosphatase RsbU (regulator of sigma subunit)